MEEPKGLTVAIKGGRSLDKVFKNLLYQLLILLTLKTHNDEKNYLDV